MVYVKDWLVIMETKKTCYDEDEIDVAQIISDPILGSFISCKSRFTSKVCGPYVVTCLVEWTSKLRWTGFLWLMWLDSLGVLIVFLNARKLVRFVFLILCTSKMIKHSRYSFTNLAIYVHFHSWK